LSQNTFEKIIDKENLEKAYRKSLKGKNKYNVEAIKFSLNETYNLQKLRQSLKDETYQFGGYTRFKVYEPKEREIYAPQFKDKIVQLAINNILKTIYQPCFICDSYASLDNKGTHKCVDRIQHFMRKAKWEYGNGVYIVKIDTRKFFYTIDRKILKSILPKKIQCRKTLRLLYKIIDSADVIDLLGLPLGDTLSQIDANIYLNKVDQYCKRKLSLNYYIRYMDDIIIIVDNKEKAREINQLVTAFIQAKLSLNINTNKTKIFPLNQGVNAIGFKIHTTHKLLRNDSKKRIKRKAKKMRLLIADGKITKEKAEQILNSWKGHAKHGNSYNFIKKLIERNDYIYINEKGILKVDMKKINKDGDTFVD
jgi:RNA-directed DNA polymerase